jgi:hypothetical protein
VFRAANDVTSLRIVSSATNSSEVRLVDKGKPDLSAQVRDWLSKEGMPFEMEVATRLQHRGFSVTQGAYYIDETTRKSREVDVIASTSRWLKTPNVTLTLRLVIECKYSRDKPWVLLTSQRSDRASIVGTDSSRVFADDNGRALLSNLKAEDVKNSLFLTGRSASGYGAVTAFKKKDSATDEAYAAPLAVAKAAQTIGKTDAKPGPFSTLAGHIRCLVTVPCVVIDGSLFTAALAEERTITIKQIPSGRLLLKNPEVGTSESVIDLVTMSGLAAYVSGLNSTLALLQTLVEADKELTTSGTTLIRTFARLAKAAPPPTSAE